MLCTARKCIEKLGCPNLLKLSLLQAHQIDTRSNELAGMRGGGGGEGLQSNIFGEVVKYSNVITCQA